MNSQLANRLFQCVLVEELYKAGPADVQVRWAEGEDTASKAPEGAGL